MKPIFKLSFVLAFRQEKYWSSQFKSETESNRLNKIFRTIQTTISIFLPIITYFFHSRGVLGLAIP